MRRTSMRGAGAALLVLGMLAGCASEGPAAEVSTSAVPGSLSPVATLLACPPGESFERMPGVCVATLARADRSLAEPELAIDPRDPARMVVGVNAGDPPTLTPTAEVAGLRALVYLTEDGGESWTELRPPVPFGPLVLSGDANPLIDRDGTLHFSAIAIPVRDGVSQYTFYSSSADMGRTWSEPVVFLENGDDDRNWNTLAPDGTLIVAWQRYLARTTELAWTRDAGATFERLTIEDCAPTSPVVYDGDVPLVACYVDGEVLVHALDLATATSTLVGKADEAMIFPILARGADGTLWLGGSTRDGPKLSRSVDHGATWETIASVDEDVGAVRAAFRWLAADPWGNVHVIIEQGAELCGLFAGASRALCQFEHINDGVTFYATYDANGTLASSAQLTPPDVRAPPPLVPGMFDDFHSLAFAPDHGVMAWTFDKGLDFTRIERAP